MNLDQAKTDMPASKVISLLEEVQRLLDELGLKVPAAHAQMAIDSIAQAEVSN